MLQKAQEIFSTQQQEFCTEVPVKLLAWKEIDRWNLNPMQWINLEHHETQKWKAVKTDLVSEQLCGLRKMVRGEESFYICRSCFAIMSNWMEFKNKVKDEEFQTKRRKFAQKMNQLPQNNSSIKSGKAVSNQDEMKAKIVDLEADLQEQKEFRQQLFQKNADLEQQLEQLRILCTQQQEQIEQQAKALNALQSKNPPTDSKPQMIQQQQQQQEEEVPTVMVERRPPDLQNQSVRSQLREPNRLRIIEDYELRNKVRLSRGGFAEIYRAEYNGRAVAVKCFELIGSQGLAASQISKNDENFARFFLQEVINSAQIQSAHRNVIGTIGCGLDVRSGRNLAFIVLELVEGGNLWNFIQQQELQQYLQQPRFEDERAQNQALLRLCLEIVSGIQFLHDHNLQHCDLKPHNILIKKFLEGANNQFEIVPIIIDLGVSVVMGEKTKLNTEIFGISEVWMPREYLHEESVSPKTDVWSLGCVIFYIYSRGHKPWELAKANMVTVLLYNREDFFKHVEDNAVQSVGAIRELLDRCLQYDHHNRCTVQELKALLEKAIQNI